MASTSNREIPSYLILGAAALLLVNGFDLGKNIMTDVLASMSPRAKLGCLSDKERRFNVCKIDSTSYELTVNGWNPFMRSDFAAKGSNFLHSTCIGRLERSWLPIGPVGTFKTDQDCVLKDLA